ncbi:MAG: DMT family transporter [Flavobacteriales bacterium]|nr:DMT family transporter [Flavobacteriales bacterium]
MTNSLRAHLALSAAAIIYGANYIIAKSVMPDPIGPNSFIVLRVVGAAVLFWLIVARRIQIPDKEDWGRLLLCAICGVATNQLLFFNGLALTSPINASIMMTSNPIIVMVISAVLLKQKINALKILGIMLGAAGAIAIIMLSTYDTSEDSSWQGDVCILINSLSWGFYLVLVKPLMKRYNPVMITAWIFLIGIILVLPFGGSGASEIEWMQLSAWQWFSILYVIVFVTFLTYLLNMIGIHLLSPTVASAYIYFQPLLAGVFAFLFSFFLGKDFTGDITWLKVACGVLVFAGVYLVSRSESAQKT